jgi:chemotaxis protein histidine kinase CheA
MSAWQSQHKQAKEMTPQNLEKLKQAQQILTQIMGWAKRTFDVVATWVTQLSWWKFFIFAVITLICGNILQESLFSPRDDSSPDPKPKLAHKHTESGPRSFTDGDTHVTIDHSGIHIYSDKDKAEADKDKAEAAKAKAEGDKEDNGNEKSEDDKQASQEPEAPPAMAPPPPAEPAKPAKPAQPMVTGSKDDIHINLPPEVTQEVSDAIDEEVDAAAAKRIAKNSSTWFMNFVLLLVFALLGTKALMGGKKRAEVQAAQANETAEREALKRQVSEAKMQMMQAQVEPHFLFNTLASVEFLIETDPPRASAMQRSLIQYLRAVLPQMREAAPITNLGREADMVRAYLNLLKMRMEERLHIEFNVPEGLRSAAFPPMMLQSLVENAIKHGLEPKAEGGTLSVRAEVAHNKLCVIVTDDGMGFGVVPSTSTGLGLQSIRERLKLLHGDQAQLVIVPNTPSGVCSTIEVPYQLAK